MSHRPVHNWKLTVEFVDHEVDRIRFLWCCKYCHMTVCRDQEEVPESENDPWGKIHNEMECMERSIQWIMDS